MTHARIGVTLCVVMRARSAKPACPDRPLKLPGVPGDARPAECPPAGLAVDLVTGTPSAFHHDHPQLQIGGKSLTIRCDVSSAIDVHAAVEAVHARFG